MAADLSRAAAAAATTALCLAAAWPRPGLAAPPLGDPTRPPAFAAPAAEPGAHRAGPSRAATPTPSAPPPAPVLQSLQIGLGPASALVDGRLLRVGDRVGTRTITAIDAQGLTLRSEAGRSERLELLNGVVKHAVGAAPAGAGVQARLHEPAWPLPRAQAAEPVASASSTAAVPAPPGGKTTP